MFRRLLSRHFRYPRILFSVYVIHTNLEAGSLRGRLGTNSPFALRLVVVPRFGRSRVVVDGQQLQRQRRPLQSQTVESRVENSLGSRGCLPFSVEETPVRDRHDTHPVPCLLVNSSNKSSFPRVSPLRLAKSMIFQQRELRSTEARSGGVLYRYLTITRRERDPLSDVYAREIGSNLAGFPSDAFRWDATRSRNRMSHT